MALPSISVVIPSYNQGAYIERTLLSIIKQDYQGVVQIIVSDGGSKDQTVDVLKKYDAHLTWWSNPDKGFVDAVTKGAAVATGDIIAIQSSDDYYLDGAFSRLVEGFTRFPDAAFISGGDYLIDNKTEVRAYTLHNEPITPQRILFTGPPPQHGTFLKRSYFNKVGGLRHEVDVCADIDLWYRVSHLQPGHFLDSFVAAYQLHPEQRTSTLKTWYNGLVTMVESCEKDTMYGAIYKATENEKKSLYLFWQLSELVRFNIPEARKIAESAATSSFDYTDRVKKMIGDLLSDYDENGKAVKSKKQAIKDFLMPLREKIPFRKSPNSFKPLITHDLDWWQQQPVEKLAVI